ncbi:MAG: RNA polymerase sigma factor [Planctomycetes bacterium]|nr:RNA polymerase sigma factor [Planctomycetota bacterium]
MTLSLTNPAMGRSGSSRHAPPGLADILARLALDPKGEAWQHLFDLVGFDIALITRQYASKHFLHEDAIQETLLQVRRDAKQFKSGAGNPDAAARRWIVTIAVNTSLDLIRTRKRAAARDRAVGTALPLQTTTSAGPLGHIARREAKESLMRALARLPEPQRAPLELRYLKGQEYAEIAQQLNVPEATARTRVHRGIAALRDVLRGLRPMR